MSVRAARLLLAIALAIGAPSAALGGGEDRVAELSAKLEPSRSEKERIAAVTALGRLQDKRTLKPLVDALRDKSPTVRAIAALALGKLGHRAALPALRQAQQDDDALVRKRARAAVIAVSDANGIAIEDVDTVGKPGFGNKPKALAARPELYVVVKSASDDTPAKGRAAYDKKTRVTHAEIAKTAMNGALRANATVTGAAKDASKFGLDCNNVDVIITKLETRTVGSYIEVEAQLRLAISDGGGKMRSFLTGGAKVQVKKSSYNTAYLPQLRREAIENAVRGILDKLLAHLRRGAKA